MSFLNFVIDGIMFSDTTIIIVRVALDITITGQSIVAIRTNILSVGMSP